MLLFVLVLVSTMIGGVVPVEEGFFVSVIIIIFSDFEGCCSVGVVVGMTISSFTIWLFVESFLLFVDVFFEELLFLDTTFS